MAVLRYSSKAERFEEAIPIGAGRIGAMVYGDPHCETLRLNEDSVWSGGLRSRVNPSAKEGFAAVRDLVMHGKIAEAERLAFETMQGCTPNMRHYMPLGDLRLALTLPDGEITDYRRELDLDNALCAVTFRVGGAQFRREIIASAPAQCILIHLTAEIPFDVSASMDGRDDYYDNNRVNEYDRKLFLEYDGGCGGADGIRFAAALSAASADGTPDRVGNRLTVTCTKDVTFAFAVRTSYYHPQADLAAYARADADNALSQSWENARDAHIADYQALYLRSELTLPDDAYSGDTDTLLEQIRGGDLSHLNALLVRYFDFGRYLMIAGSREGSLPLNLQGIWNVDMWPAWGSRFTVNINTEMNYWGVESCNLPECHLPLFALLEKVMENGRITAREMYGLDGFCCHHNTDLWGDTAPQDLWMPATIWPMGGAWLALHIMEHFRYTMDMDFLRRYYPILREAARFFSGYLTENAQGQLVTCPSVSPENTYQLENGEKGCLCAGPSMDSQIITELYGAVLESAQILALDEPLAPTLRDQLQRLPRPQIGKYGQIMEWAVDYDEVEPAHRHISQLFALHPARQISPQKPPQLAKAAAATLHRRLTHGGGHTGWSCAWIANMYARLHDGAHVLDTLTKLMQHSTNPNLFDMHPPFQIDGNFGGSAAIAEALLQSDSDGIRLLPALPDAWHSGAFRGLCAWGGFTLDVTWTAGKITQICVRAKHGGMCRLCADGAFMLTETGQTIGKEADGFMCLETVPAGVYHLTAL